jgi:hypothetical protein
MPGLTVNVLLQDIKKLETDAVLVGFFEDVRPLAHLAGELDWLLCGALSNLIINQKLRGCLGEVALIASRGKVPAQKIFLVGLGPSATVTADLVRIATRSAVSSALHAGVKDMALECFSAPGLSVESLLNGMVQGAAEGSAGAQATVHLLASDAGHYEQISKLVNSRSGGQQGQAVLTMSDGVFPAAVNTDDTRRT